MFPFRELLRKTEHGTGIYSQVGFFFFSMFFPLCQVLQVDAKNPLSGSPWLHFWASPVYMTVSLAEKGSDGISGGLGGCPLSLILAAELAHSPWRLPLSL